MTTTGPALGGILCESTTYGNISPGELWTFASERDVLEAWGLGRFERIRVHLAHSGKRHSNTGSIGNRAKVTRVRYITATVKEDVQW